MQEADRFELTSCILKITQKVVTEIICEYCGGSLHRKVMQ
jgi:hypothetical protein